MIIDISANILKLCLEIPYKFRFRHLRVFGAVCRITMLGFYRFLLDIFLAFDVLFFFQSRRSQCQRIWRSFVDFTFSYFDSFYLLVSTRFSLYRNTAFFFYLFVENRPPQDEVLLVNFLQICTNIKKNNYIIKKSSPTM